ncbi:hypothetical protein [Microbacterium sp. P5_E9]
MPEPICVRAMAQNFVVGAAVGIFFGGRMAGRKMFGDLGGTIMFIITRDQVTHAPRFLREGRAARLQPVPFDASAPTSCAAAARAHGSTAALVEVLAIPGRPGPRSKVTI